MATVSFCCACTRTAATCAWFASRSASARLTSASLSGISPDSVDPASSRSSTPVRCRTKSFRFTAALRRELIAEGTGPIAQRAKRRSRLQPSRLLGAHEAAVWVDGVGDALRTLLLRAQELGAQGRPQPLAQPGNLPLHLFFGFPA